MSYLSDFEHTKLDAHVFPGMVVETHSISDASAGKRRVLQTRIWKVERLLGKGATFKVEYERELKALLEFSKPKYKESAVFVEFLGWFQDVESVYLAMEYVPLGDLEDNVVKLGGKISEGEVKEITVQILEGLKIMHLESFVHRDLKPKVECLSLSSIAKLVVPFPPGLSLTSFCGDESRFPSKALYMSDSGKDFIRKVIVAHPSRRLTSGEALEHEWTRPDSKIPDESIGQLIAPNDHTTKDTSESFGGYNTDTHAGLQSYGNRSTRVATPAVHLTAPPKPLPSKYQQPTMEDESEPENIGGDSAHEAGTQVLPTKDGGIHGALPGQDEDLVDQDHTIKPTNRKARKATRIGLAGT
ncbi:kinase-like domain-containing protein [Leptodontidium sp. MPI-SDFR-AT-0119]|nr:kinase-like domain-containing protein [Leptodontidium sp. MPI-SDFR-AT-0119]